MAEATGEADAPETDHPVMADDLDDLDVLLADLGRVLIDLASCAGRATALAALRQLGRRQFDEEREVQLGGLAAELHEVSARLESVTAPCADGDEMTCATPQGANGAARGH